MRDKLVVTAIKGIVPDENLTVSRYFEKAFNVPEDQVACIGGPSHAEEVALDRLCYLTAGCRSVENAQLIADMLAGKFVKASVSTDIEGFLKVARHGEVFIWNNTLNGSHYELVAHGCAQFLQVTFNIRRRSDEDERVGSLDNVVDVGGETDAARVEMQSREIGRIVP